MMKKMLAIVLMMTLLVGAIPFASADLQEKDEKVKAEYNAAKQRYTTFVAAYKVARNDWITARNAWSKAQTAPNTQAALEKAQDFLLAADDAMQGQLEWTKAKIEGMPDGVLSNRADLIAGIDNNINDLENLKSEIEAAQTREDINAIAAKIKNRWMDARYAVKKAMGEILVAQFDYVLEKLDTFTNSIDARIVELDAKGVDTTELEEWNTAVQDAVADVKIDYENAKETFRKLKSGPELDTQFRNGHAYIKNADKNARYAYKVLKGIIYRMKNPDTSVAGNPYITDVKSSAGVVADAEKRVKPLATVSGNRFISGVSVTGTAANADVQ
jgi:chromosome segregation ATPase